MIKAYLTDTVVLKQYKGEDEYGTPNSRTEVSLKARVDYKNRNVIDLSGEEVVSMARVLLSPMSIIRSGFSTRSASTIAYEDVLEVDGVDHAIVSIGKQGDFSTRYMEVYIA